METVEFTNMCMVHDMDTDCVMIQERVGNWPGPAFPGGHVEYGEPFTDSVIREVWEETGLRIRHPALCGTKDWMCDDGRRYVVMLYTATEFEGSVHSSSEGQVHWVPVSELDSLPMQPDMKKTLPLFFNCGCSEMWYKGSDCEMK